MKELEATVVAVKAGGLVVDRFFSTANYSPDECKKVIALLLTSAEPLTSFKDIKDAEVKDVLVDNEGNLSSWLNTRKAIASVALSEPVKATLLALAEEGRLDRLKKLAKLGAELRAIAGKTLEAVVTSAAPLSKAQQEAVAKALPAYAGAGSSVVPIFVVDASIVGGLTVTLKNQSIDLSVNSRLVEVASLA